MNSANLIQPFLETKFNEVYNTSIDLTERFPHSLIHSFITISDIIGCETCDECPTRKEINGSPTHQSGCIVFKFG